MSPTTSGITPGKNGNLTKPSTKMAQEYRRQANRRRMADSGQDKVDNVVKLRADVKAKKAAQNGQ